MDVPWNLSSFLEAEYPSGDSANILVVRRVVDMGISVVLKASRTKLHILSLLIKYIRLKS